MFRYNFLIDMCPTLALKLPIQEWGIIPHTHLIFKYTVVFKFCYFVRLILNDIDLIYIYHGSEAILRSATFRALR